MRTLTVPIEHKSYPIYIGNNLDFKALFARHITHKQVLVVTNTTVFDLYYQSIIVDNMPASCMLTPHILLDGEEYKTLESYAEVLNTLLAQKYARDCVVVALGGGVVGDIAGFVAASYQRGVDFIQVPTTLLSQVDSSVGGKTGVNHPLGKNMIGAFKQPLAVFAEINVLSTLNARDFSSGIAEVIKYALIRDSEFLAWLEVNMPGILSLDPALLATAIYRSCEHKAQVVAADEFEGGVRALLNFGHTFGHAIETIMGYGVIYHGEAVAMGMIMASDLSMRLSNISADDVERICAIIRSAGLPVCVPSIDINAFTQAMWQDKKVKQGQLRLVLLQQIGSAIVTAAYPSTLLDQTLASYLVGAA